MVEENESLKKAIKEALRYIKNAGLWEINIELSNAVKVLETALK